MGQFQYSAEGLSGHIHPFGGIFLIEGFEIGQTNCLELIDRQTDVLQDRERDTPRFVIGALRQLSNASEVSWSRHLFPLQVYPHTHRTGKTPVRKSFLELFDGITACAVGRADSLYIILPENINSALYPFC